MTADSNYKRLTCERCAKDFSHPRQTKYCSRPCRDGSKMTRDEWREAVHKDAVGNFECEHCGIKAHRKLSGSTGSVNRFCSMACRSGYSVAAKVADKSERMRLSAIRSLAKALLRVANPTPQKQIIIRPPCVVCGKDCGYVFGRAKSYCSKKCRQSTEMFKDARRADKGKRKALMRGVHAEQFAPNRVFDRDGWRCQICGVSTPKSRRGSLHANAPELDHIKPLSKGGHHTKDNTQCACRACNGWKSDRVAVGQIGLFSSLVAS